MLVLVLFMDGIVHFESGTVESDTVSQASHSLFLDSLLIVFKGGPRLFLQDVSCMIGSV